MFSETNPVCLSKTSHDGLGPYLTRTSFHQQFVSQNNNNKGCISPEFEDITSKWKEGGWACQGKYLWYGLADYC